MENVGIRITVRDDEQALRRLEKIDQIVKYLNKTVVRIRFSQSMPQYGMTLNRLSAVERQLRSIQERSNRQLRLRFNTSSMNALRRMDRTLASIRARADRPMTFRVSGTQAVTSLRRIQREFQRTEQEARRASANIGTNLGGGLLTAGAALRTLSNNVFSNFARNIGATIASSFTAGIMDGISRITNRIDTMNTAPQLMATSLGISEPRSRKLLKQLDEAVRGLPTPLEDITSAWKQYSLALGDANKGAQVAIAANNAFLASASSETDIYQGTMQLKDLFAGKKLQTREWYSLIGAMPAGIAEIGKALGYVDTASFQRALLGGEVSSEKFIEGLIKAGTVVDGVKGKLVEMADISKQTLAGWQRNFATAIARGGKDIYDALNSTLEKATGKGVVATLYEINDAIDKLANKIVSWIKKHPEKITEWLDRIKNYNWAGVGKGILSIVRAFEFMARALAKMPGLAAPLSFFAFGGGNMLANLTLVTGGIIRAIGRFNEAAADIKKGEGTFASLGRLFRAQGRAGRAARGASASAPAIARSVGTWSSLGRGLAKAFAGAGLIFAYGAAIYKLAGWLQKIQNMGLRLNKIQPAMGNIALAIGEMTLIAYGLGALVTAGGPITMALAGGGLAMLAGIGGALAALGKGINAVGSAKVASPEKVRKIGESLGIIFDVLGKAAKNPVGAMDVGNYSFVVKSFADMAKSAEGLRGIKLPSAFEVEDIGETVKAMMDAIEEVFGKDGSVGQRFTSWNRSKTAGHIDEIWKAFASTLKTLQSAHKGLTAVSKLKFSKGFAEKVKTNLQELAGGIGEIVDFTRNLFAANVSGGKKAGKPATFDTGTLKVTPNEVKRYGQIVTNASGILTALVGLAGQFPKITQAVAALKKIYGTTKHGNLKTSPIRKALEQIAGLMSEISDPEILQRLQGASDRLKGIKLDKITTAIQAIPELVKAIGLAMQATASAPWLNRRTGSGTEGFIGRITEMVKTLNSISLKINGVSSFAGKAKSLHNSLTWLNRAIKLLIAITTKINAGGFDTGAIKTSVAQAITDLSTALEKSAGVSVRAAMFYSAAKSLRDAFKALTSGKGDSIKAFLDALNKIPTALKNVSMAMRGKGTEWKNELVNGFSGTGQAIIDEINSIPPNLPTSGFYQSGVAAAASYVSGFISQSLASRLSDFVHGFSGYSRGGEVQYFARGGRPRRRGNDTVSAMLTPGEFVARRGAVQHFGSKFFEKINNLDLDGALKAISYRAVTPGAKVYVDRSQTTNNTNNAKVTMNIQNAPQEYTQMRANRWIRALT